MYQGVQLNSVLFSSRTRRRFTDAWRIDETVCRLTKADAWCYNFTARSKFLTTLHPPPFIDPKAKYWSKIAIFAIVRAPRQNMP